jgi:hypothetical protein
MFRAYPGNPLPPEVAVSALHHCLLPKSVCLAVPLYLTVLAAACGTPAGPGVTDAAATQADVAGGESVDATATDVVAKGLPAAAQLFDPKGIHTVSIELPAADWSALLADALDVKRKRDWHAATVTFDGQAFQQVGVRDFGDGSQQTNPKKPNVRLKFDQIVQTAVGPGGEVNLRLKAGGTEATFLREPLFFELVRSLGAPAPRWSFARVTVNGAPYGLYQVFEHPGQRLFEHFLGKPLGPDAKAHDYTPAISCVGLACPAKGCAGLGETYALAAGTGGDLTALVQAIEKAPDAELQTQVEAIAAFDELLTLHAVEAAASEVDGIMASGANFEVFADAQGRLHTVRYGADETFYEHYDLQHPWGPPNVLCPGRTERFFSRVVAIPALRAQLVQKWLALRCGPLEHKAVTAWIEGLRGPILAELAHDPKTAVSLDDASSAMDELEAWVVERNVALTQLVGPCPK